MNYPTSFRGVVAILALLSFSVIVVYASTLGSIIGGGLVLLIAAWLVYVIGYRIDQWLKHGSLW